MDVFSPGAAAFIVDAVALGFVCWIIGACIPRPTKKSPDQIRTDEYILRETKRRLRKDNKPKSPLFGNNKK